MNCLKAEDCLRCFQYKIMHGHGISSLGTNRWLFAIKVKNMLLYVITQLLVGFVEDLVQGILGVPKAGRAHPEKN